MDPHLPPPANASEALARLGRLSVRELSMESLLQSVAELATSVLPGRIEASVSVLVKDQPHTAAFTSELAAELDETQYEAGDGPCLHAARSGELTLVPDTRADIRWRDYLKRAAEQGNLSSLSVPLTIDEEEQICGALNLYAREADAFDEEARAAAVLFGPYAGAAAGNLHAYQSARQMADNLQVALESRAVIDQAKGVLMERYRVNADQAFQILAQASMATNRKLRDVADQLVQTGELPAARGRRAGRPQGRERH